MESNPYRLRWLTGTGKTSIALELARLLGSAYLRVRLDEQAIRDSGLVSGLLEDLSYRVGYSVASDNLRLGRTVISDSVDPLQITRDAWIGVAEPAGTTSIEGEITCSDPGQNVLIAPFSLDARFSTLSISCQLNSVGWQTDPA